MPHGNDRRGTVNLTTLRAVAGTPERLRFLGGDKQRIDDSSLDIPPSFRIADILDPSGTTPRPLVPACVRAR